MSSATPETAVSSPPKRSRRRFTLRALFLAVLAAGLFFGWVAYRVREFRDQAALIADLRSRGFRVETEPLNFDYWLPLWKWLASDDAVQVRMADLRGLDTKTNRRFGPTSDDLGRIRAWTSIKYLSLFGCAVTDETLTCVRDLTALETLSLENTAVTDAGLAHLRALTSLSSLFISTDRPTIDGDESSLPCDSPVGGSAITERGLAGLASLKNLTVLVLGSAHITDEGVRVIVTNHKSLLHLGLNCADITDQGMNYISDMRSLWELHLWDCHHVTDEGLQQLQRLNKLQRLRMKGGKVSPAAVAGLKSAIPRLEIDVDGLPSVFRR